MTAETERLRGEPLAPKHLDELAAILGDPRVGATLGGVRTRAETAERLAIHVAHREREGFGYRLWRDREGRLVGRGGPERKIVEGRLQVEVGYAVVPECWGQGYATEIASASIREAFEQHGLREVVCYTLTGNTASRRVMEKAGFTYEHDFEHPPWGLHALYRLRAGG